MTIATTAIRSVSRLMHEERVAPPEALRALLQRAVQRADDDWRQGRRNECGEITGRQYDVMAVVSTMPGASQTLIVEMTGIDRSTLADIVRRLCKRGLLMRRRLKEDTRVQSVKLTDEGKRVLREVSALSHDVDRGLARALSATEQSTLRSLLHRIIAAPRKASRP